MIEWITALILSVSPGAVESLNYLFGLQIDGNIYSIEVNVNKVDPNNIDR